MNTRIARPFCVLFAAGLAASSASAQVASALVREGDLIGPGGEAVTGFGATATNQVGGYAVQITTGTLSNFWGNAGPGPGAILRTEGIVAGLTQSSFETFFGLADSGSIAYSPTISAGAPVSNADSVFVDNTPVAVAGNPAPAAIGDFWSFGSRPGMTAAGEIYWVGGVSLTSGGTTSRRGLFRGTSPTAVLISGQLVPGLPAPLNTAGPVDFDVRFSPNGLNYAVPVNTTAPTTSDRAIVVSGNAYTLDGVALVEGNAVPAAIGGQTGELWQDFDIATVNDAGLVFIQANTSAPTTQDDVLILGSSIILREGQPFAGQTIVGVPQHIYLANNGSWAATWDLNNGAASRTALIVNNQVILQEGQPVDLDGNGTVEPNSILAALTGGGGSPLSISAPAADGSFTVYFTADVDTAGTTSTTDDISAYMRVVIPCYANCDGSTAAPVLNALDFSCFLNRFRAEDPYANCDGSTAAPVLNALDFSCFLNRFRAGCP